VVGAQAQVT